MSAAQNPGDGKVFIGRPIKMSLDKAFDLIVQAARAGAPCPRVWGDQRTPGLFHYHYARLVAEGRIRSEISRNGRSPWRQVHILTGPYAGLCTAPNPRDGSAAPRTKDARARADACPQDQAGFHVVCARSRPSDWAEAEREERLHGYAARDLTGARMGDPPVGFSALDRRGR